MLLHVIVKKARTNFENGGKMKTYLIVQAEDLEFRTNVVRGDDPVWHQAFTFPIENMFNNLVIKYMQSGLFFDDLIGIMEIPFTNIPFSSKLGKGEWREFSTDHDKIAIKLENELLFDYRIELPDEFTEEEEKELTNKLTNYNEILQKEVETLTRQNHKIRSEGFSITSYKDNDGGNNPVSLSSYPSNEGENDNEEDLSVFQHESENGFDESNILGGNREDYVITKEEDRDNMDGDESNHSGKDTDSITSSLSEKTQNDNISLRNSVDGEKEQFAQSSDPEADKDMKQNGNFIENPGLLTRTRFTQASVKARKNWRKALDDVKKARESGIYTIVNNESEEFSARERVKSILQSASPSPQKKMRPKSLGDMLYTAQEEDEDDEAEGSNLSKPRAASENEQIEPKRTNSRFRRRYGIRHSPSRKRKQS